MCLTAMCCCKVHLLMSTCCGAHEVITWLQFLVALVPLWHLFPREALLRAAASMDAGLCRRVTGCSMQWVGRETHAHLQREDIDKHSFIAMAGTAGDRHKT